MKRILLVGLVALSALLQAAEPGLLFHAGFDSYSVDADFCKGKKTGSGLPEKDLQLRMFPGPNNKGNSLTLSFKERVRYKAEGNIDPRKGTVSMWISPINWDMAGDDIFTVFNFSDKGRAIRLFKHAWGPYIIGQYQWKVGKKVYSRQVQKMVDPREWGKGKWHQIAISWDQDNMQLFIDGVRLPEPPRGGVPRFWNNKPAPPDYPVGRKKFPKQLPALQPGGWIYLGDIFQNKKVPDNIRTAVDEVKIYNYALNANEMRKEYERVMPPAPSTKQVPHLITVPKGKDPSLALLLRPMSAPTRKINASAALRHDGKNLYISYFADFPCLVKNKTKRDAYLWEDDSFELHLVSPRKERFQFIVNGNGAYLDTKNKKTSWNPQGVKTQVKLNKDSWRADLTIPLAALGDLEGSWLADFTVAQHLGNKTNYYRWSDIVFDNSFTATGHLRFLKTADYVHPAVSSSLGSGKLDLKAVSARGVKITAQYTPSGQKAIVYPGSVTQWKTQLPAGKLRLAVNARKGKEILYRYYADCYIDYPLEVEFNTVAKSGKIDLNLNFGNAGGAFLSSVLPKGVKGTAQLLSQDGKVLSHSSFVTKSVKSTASLVLPEDLGGGDCILRVTAGGFTRDVEYRVPDMTPYKKKLGVDQTVPWPWHPVKELGKNRYEVLERIFTFDGKSPLPKSITIKGEELFTSRPEFSFGGKPVNWTNFRLSKKAPDHLTFTAEGKVSGGKIGFVGELWFDGMYKMNISLNVPKAETFFFSAAVGKEFGRYVMDPYMLEWKNNRVTANVRGYNTNEKRAAGFMWLTGYEKGFCFWNKSNANWINTPGRPSFDIRRDSQKVSFLARIIDKKVTLSRTADYTLVIQPTPPRVPKKDHRRFNFCSYGRCKEVSHDFGTLPGRIPTSPVMVRPKYPEKFDQLYPGRNIKVLIYTMPGHLNTWEPDMDLWDKNDRNLPGITHSGVAFGKPWLTWGYCTNATKLPADLWTWWIDETMKRHPKCGGLYFDLATVRNCENAAHGCAGVDMFGQKYFSNDALGLRDFFLRIYKTIHKRKGDIVLHCHVAYIPFVHSFIDSFAPGENTFTAACRNLWYAYTEEISPDIYLSELNWRKAGVPYGMILQLGRACDLMPALKKHTKEILGNPEYAIRALTAMAVYDVNVWGHYAHRPTIDKYWRIRREINIDDVTDYYGYWVSDAVRSGASKVYCGWFKWENGKGPYRRVLIVSNFNRNTVDVKLSLDWKKLGIEPVKTFDDLWNNKTLTLEQLKNTQLKGAHFMMIGIK